MTTVRYLVTYDIGDDERREDISLFLTGYGPRVQLSVFEVGWCHECSTKLPEIYRSAATSAPVCRT